ncbi:hypothetical protein ACWDA3_54960 [Nonomuraea rubra]
MIPPGPDGLLGDLDRPAAAVVDPHDHAGRSGLGQRFCAGCRSRARGVSLQAVVVNVATSGPAPAR